MAAFYVMVLVRCGRVLVAGFGRRGKRRKKGDFGKKIRKYFMKGIFQEIPIYIPWFGGYMLPLNEKPMRIYVYAADVKALGKSSKYLNPLFLDLKEEYKKNI
jgi:hypothetical protein